MTPSQRTTKQIFIAVIFFLIIGGLGFLIYRGASPVQPTPTPHPAANLAPIQVVFTKLFNIENNDYNFLAKVTNPNTDYGSPNVEYEIFFFGFAGTQISQKTGGFYILPGQTKYLVDLPLKFQEPISRAEFSVKSVDWQKVSSLAIQGVPLTVRGVSLAPAMQGGLFSKVGGEVFNASDFDLSRVEVTVVVVDESGMPIAADKTEINTFIARTKREFEVTLPSSLLVGAATRIDVEATTNVFENSNFLRQYGEQERFKQMY